MKKSAAIILALLMLLPLLPVLGPVNANAASDSPFSVRTAAPSKSNKYYLNTAYKNSSGVSGLNQCIVIDDSTGYVLPNCVGYAWGRAYEAFGKKPKLSKGNASSWYSYNKNGGYYPYGSKPKPGAIVCWSGGSEGYGHVAFVEEVSSDGKTITISESCYGGSKWRSVSLKTANVNTRWSGYSLQGYIYTDPLVLTINFCANGGYVQSDRYYLVENSDLIYDNTISGIKTQAWTYGTVHSDGLINNTSFGLKREGYRFLGWSQKPSGAEIIDQNQALQPEQLVPSLKDGSKKITMYAIWEKVEETIEPVQDEIVEIEITSLPEKTQYYVGEALNQLGLSVQANHSNGTVSGISLQELTVISDFSEAGQSQVVVLYQGFAASFEVTVIEPLIDIEEESLSLNVGETTVVHTTCNPSCVVSFSSLNDSIARIDSNGIVSAAAKGSTTLIATIQYNGFVYTDMCDISVETDQQNPVYEDPDEPQIMVDSKIVNRGREFTVNVSVKNNPGVMALTLLPAFSEGLTLTKVENGNLMTDFTAGKSYFWTANDDVTANGTLMTLTFTTNEDLEPGDYSVSFTLWDSSDSQENDVPFAMVSGSITVTDFIWGDANGDGAVNNKDIVRLKNYFANLDDATGTSSVAIYSGADANGDGAVNNKDIVRLKNYFANLDDATGLSSVILGPAA